jgi:predicted  nucleic acid-binding Zn-ribbon protein
MWRIAPVNDSALETIRSLQAENSSLVASLAALHIRCEALEQQNACLLEQQSSSPQVVRSLCARVVELTQQLAAQDECTQRNISRFQRKLKEVVFMQQKSAKESEDLKERVRQLQGEMAALQDSDHANATELRRVKRDIAQIKEHLTCSVSYTIMEKPCILSTGQMYNRDSIIEWLWKSGSHRCPNTNGAVKWHDYQPATSPALNEVCAILARM